jgi:hypothetical protein
MNWLLVILRFVLGISASDQAGTPPVAIRPDGSTVVLPPENAVRRKQVSLSPIWPWDWLLPHLFGRDTSISAPSVVDHFEHGLTRTPLGDHARRHSPDESWNR